jgi:hypothetical protein
MAGNPEYQDVHQAGPPPNFTPPGGPSSPANYAMVTPHGRGPAPYDIQAPLDDLSGACAEAEAVWGAGTLNPRGPREQQAAQLMDSAQGFGLDGFDVDAGWHGSWPANVEPSG